MLSELINNSPKTLRNELYRKSIHLSSVWMPLLIYFAPQKLSLLIFAVLFTADLFIEYGCYKKISWTRKLFEGLFIKTLRGREIRKNRFRPSGSVYLLGSAFLSVWLFPAAIAAIGMSIALISDTCAAIFGKVFGTRRIYGTKSLEGTAMFFLSALYIMTACNPIFPFAWAGVAACTAATLCELYESILKIDDNLSIPLAVGFILTFL